MPKLFLLFLLTANCYTSFAQPLHREHIITCLTVVDDKGKLLLTDSSNSIEIETFPYLPMYTSASAKDFSETYKKDEESTWVYFDNYAGTRAAVHSPFTNEQFLISGELREFLLTRCGDEDCEEMRVILLNNKRRTDSSRTTVYVINNIVFKPGTYEIDCSKFSSVINTSYDTSLNLCMYTVKTKLKPREQVNIPAKAFYNYYVNGYKFLKNNHFNYETGGCGMAGKGNGVYVLNDQSIKCIYEKPADRVEPMVEIIAGNHPAQVYSVKCRLLDDKGYPLVSASVSIKGSRTGVATDNDGYALLKIKAGDFIHGIVLTVSSIGFQSKEIQLREPSNYDIKCVMDSPNMFYYDSGHVEQGIFTDYTDDYIGIYWLVPGETFSFNNQEQMKQRVLYYHRRIRQGGVVCVD